MILNLSVARRKHVGQAGRAVCIRLLLFDTSGFGGALQHELGT